MPLISTALTTLADVKDCARLSSSFTSDDGYLTKLINKVSIQVAQFCNRNFKRTAYVVTMNPSMRQLLCLENYPIQTITYIKDQGVTLTAGTDYLVLPEYSNAGQVYRGQGWVGNIFIRGLVGDFLSTEYTLEVSYTAGYYLPADVGYSAGDSASLPYDLGLCVAEMAALQYLNTVRGAQGLKSHSEGGISDTYDSQSSQSLDVIEFTGGLRTEHAQILNKYKKWIAA